MPWRGYNFEDAILVSEKLVKDGIYTSIHVEEFEIEARDTRLGPEEITCDIPNVGDEALKDLDETGIIRVGAEVGPGDILVGKVTPKSETELSPEEKLLRAIFGEKAGDVRDASLKVPPGVEGIIVDIKEFSRKSSKAKSREEKKIENQQVREIEKYIEQQKDKLRQQRIKKLIKYLVGQKVVVDLVDKKSKKTIITANRKITEKQVRNLEYIKINSIKIKDNKNLEEEVTRREHIFEDQLQEFNYEYDREIDKIKRGDELPPGVIKRLKFM